MSGFWRHLLTIRDVIRTLTATLCLMPAAWFAATDCVTASALPVERSLQESSIQQPGPWSFEFRNEPLDQVLFVISEYTGTDFIYEPGITAGISVTAAFRDKELRFILDELLLPVGLEARRIRTGIFVIRHSLRKELTPRLLPALQAGDPFKAHVSLRRIPVAAADNDMPLREIILQIVMP